ncbi:hypothetical protein CEXT_468761 [Caerostris extrusa]|uniref:Uncharacterized protein n=1 Tax=Caerostris extrusa TaxID=172846 RepID=A0AAV4P3Q0_CAEEX|nr:hypothetical protein CEXT_468761 [Caerostris extrusa]
MGEKNRTALSNVAERKKADTINAPQIRKENEKAVAFNQWNTAIHPVCQTIRRLSEQNGRLSSREQISELLC